MLNELSALKLDAALLKLELLQRQREVPAEGQLRELLDEPVQEFGAAPIPGEVSLRHLATLGNLPLSTVHGVDRIGIAKLARGLREQGLPPHLAERFCALIDDIDQPELF
jgi:hypothetical protein